MQLNVGLPLAGLPVFRMKSARRQAPDLHSLPDPASLFVSILMHDPASKYSSTTLSSIGDKPFPKPGSAVSFQQPIENGTEIGSGRQNTKLRFSAGLAKNGARERQFSIHEGDICCGQHVI